MPALKKKKLGLSLPIRRFTREWFDKTFQELAGDKVNYDASERLHIFTEEVGNAISDLYERIVELQANVQLQKATMTLKITSDFLSTTSVANDTLTCVSETEFEFDFTDSLRFTKVVLGPGAGVQPHILRFDTVVTQGDDDYKASVYAKSATELQLVYWNGSSWDAVAWDEGWTVKMTQYIDTDLDVI